MTTSKKALASARRIGAGIASSPLLVLISGRGLGFVATFSIPVVLARVVDRADFGAYRELFLIYGTLFGVAQLGMAEGLYYFLPGRAEPGRANPGHLLANAVAALGVAGLLCEAAMWLGAARVAAWL